MFKHSMKLIAGLICLTLTGLAQTKPATIDYGLPTGAVVVEVQSLAASGHANRSLILWMLKPEKHPTEYAVDDIYTCPDYTRGSYYSGPTRVSLFDTANRKIINTLEIQGEDGDIDIPYKIRKGYYYLVEGVVKEGVEAKPHILWLKDYNGDGKALEFALFDAQACMGLGTTLIGYSETQGKIIQYPIHLEIVGDKERTNATQLWADYLFAKKPVRPGYWKYEIDYRGRAGSLDQYEIHYDPKKERFAGKLMIKADQ